MNREKLIIWGTVAVMVVGLLLGMIIRPSGIYDPPSKPDPQPTETVHTTRRP